MSVQIIVKDKRTETERRKAESSAQILKHYYGREQRDGTRMKLPASKERIKRLYEERGNSASQ
jgi:hypothetical protein